MGVLITKMFVCCDVAGCYKQAELTPSQLSTAGWNLRLLTDGKPYLASLLLGGAIAPAATNVAICPKCSTTGAWKKLELV
jgi:hypothetical protein